MPKIIYTIMSFLLYVYISANISKILTFSRTVDDLNKKGLAKIMANPFKIKSFIGDEGQNRTAATGIFSSRTYDNQVAKSKPQ